jgi:hypothetical protein
MLGQTYRIADCRARRAHGFMSLPVMQEAMGAIGKTSIFFIKTGRMRRA